MGIGCLPGCDLSLCEVKSRCRCTFPAKGTRRARGYRARHHRQRTAQSQYGRDRTLVRDAGLLIWPKGLCCIGIQRHEMHSATDVPLPDAVVEFHSSELVHAAIQRTKDRCRAAADRFMPSPKGEAQRRQHAMYLICVLGECIRSGNYFPVVWSGCQTGVAVKLHMGHYPGSYRQEAIKSKRNSYCRVHTTSRCSQCTFTFIQSFFFYVPTCRRVCRSYLWRHSNLGKPPGKPCAQRKTAQ